MNQPVQQSLFGDIQVAIQKRNSKKAYPFNTKNVLEKHYEKYLKIVMAASKYAVEFNDDFNPYMGGIDEHKAWSAGLNFCGPLKPD